MNVARYLGRRWRGLVPLKVLFWRDMLALGTLLNMAASFLALMLAAQGASPGVAVAVHFAPVPYNLFLVLSLWRRAHRPAAPWLVAATVWLVVMTLL